MQLLGGSSSDVLLPKSYSREGRLRDLAMHEWCSFYKISMEEEQLGLYSGG